MKKLFLVSIAIAFAILTSAGQSQIEVRIGQPYKVFDAPDKNYFQDGKGVLTVKLRGNEVLLQKIDTESLKLISSNTYKDFPLDHVIEKITSFGGRYFVFYSQWDRKNTTEQLFAREIDFDRATFIGEGNRIVAVNSKIAGTLNVKGYFSYNVKDKFDFQVAGDRSKLLINYRLKPEFRNDDISYDRIGLHVFDADMNNIWSKLITMPYTEKKMNNLDYSVDASGNAYVLTTVFDDNTTNTKKDEKINYHIEILKVHAYTGEIQIIPVLLDNKFINKVWIYETPDNNIICTGFYNNGNARSSTNGIFLCKLTKNGSISGMNSYEIPLDILNQFESKWQQKKNNNKELKDDAEFENLELTELLVESDGSILLIGEQKYSITTTSYTSNGNMVTSTTYYYNDMLVTKLHPDGALAWMHRLPKRQMSKSRRGGTSYKLFIGENSYYFLFLDNLKNAAIRPDEVPALHVDGAGGYLTTYKLDQVSGKVTKFNILDTRNVNKMPIHQFSTGRIISLSASEFMFEVYKKMKEDIMIKVTMI